MQRQDNFQIFGSAHLLTIGVILLIAACFVLAARKKEWQPLARPMSWALVLLLLCNELIFLILVITKGIWSYKWGLPLQICDLAIFAVCFSLIKHRQFVWELAYFWGLGGTLQAILTPDLIVTFPDLIYMKFFLTHGCILIGVIYLSVGLGRPIYFSSLKRVWLITHLYALFMGVLNWVFDTNYAYLCAKPSQTSILDYFGAWPNYLLGLEMTFIVSLFIYYLPYYFVKKCRSVDALAK